MNMERKEKPKNGTGRRRMWWRMGAAFLVGVVVTLVVVQISIRSGSGFVGYGGRNETVAPGIFMTATAIIQEATARAGVEQQAGTVTPNPMLEGINATATALIQRITEQAEQ